MAQVQVEVPDIGDYDEVPVIEVHVNIGDTVAAEDSLITLESDKASMEIPSPVGGKITELKVKIGDKVSKGKTILVLEATEAEEERSTSEEPAPEKPQPAPEKPQPAPEKPQPAPEKQQKAPVEETPTPPAQMAKEPSQSIPQKTEEGSAISHASPSVRKFARELGVHINQVNGTGPKKRIRKEDVQRYVKSILTGSSSPQSATTGNGLELLPWPKIDFGKFGEIESQPLSRIQKISAANLTRNWVVIPAVTYYEQADITELEKFRKQVNQQPPKEGVKLTLLAFLIKASIKALQKFPRFNSSLDGDTLILKKYYHIGFAADTPNGLVVPVLRDADKKGVLEIAEELTNLAALARSGRLKPEQMQGASFTISSLGGVGGTAFSPIINAPEVAILGVSKAAMQPVWDGQQFQPRLICPLSLTADHRVIDGVLATQFNVYLAELLADFRKTTL